MSKIENYLNSLSSSIKDLISCQNSDDMDWTDDSNCQDVVESEVESIETDLKTEYFTLKQQNKLRRLLDRAGYSCTFKKGYLQKIH